MTTAQKVHENDENGVSANMNWESAIKIRRMAAQNALRARYGYVKVGYSCNNDCLFCTASWKKRHGDRATQTILEEVERIVSQDRVEQARCTQVVNLHCVETWPRFCAK